MPISPSSRHIHPPEEVLATMSETRWIHRAGAVIATLGAVAVLASTTVGAAARPWSPPTCGGPPLAPSATERTSATTWYRERPFLVDGTLSGTRLTMGLVGAGGWRTLALDAEAFAAGPFGDTVLIGTDDGRRSSLSLVAVRDDCAWPIATSPDVIRRATIAADGLTVYEMRVDRSTRADLGIWRRSLAGIGQPERVLEPIPADARFGRTFATEFTWSSDGTSLAVRSCGEIACRVRLLDAATGQHRLIADPGMGDVIGLTDAYLVVHGACRGLPCPVVSVPLAGGTPIVLEASAGLATMVRLPDDTSRVVLEAGPDGRSLLTIDPDGRRAKDLGRQEADQRLLPLGRSAAAVALPPGWLAFDGPAEAPDGPPGGLVRDIVGGRAVLLDEVPR
jgi:hypothetical protein